MSIFNYQGTHTCSGIPFDVLVINKGTRRKCAWKKRHQSTSQAADVCSQITPVGHLYTLNSSILYKDASQLSTAVLCIQLQKII